MDLPPLDASEGEVLSALASAFHSKALVVVETERDAPRGKPALPENMVHQRLRNADAVVKLPDIIRLYLS